MPKAHIIGMRQEIFCLSFKQQKICDDFNKKQDKIADQEFKKCRMAFAAWKETKSIKN